MTLHDLFTLLILPDRNIGVQYIRYTSEYILMFQIHQQGPQKITYFRLQYLFHLDSNLRDFSLN